MGFMGILDGLGKAVKDTAKGITDEVKRREEIRRTKHRILDRFEVSDLKGICNTYGINNPLPYTTNPINGDKYKRDVTRTVWIDHVISNLKLEQIKNYAEKHRIKIYDILNEGKTEAIEDIKPTNVIKTEMPKEHKEIDTAISLDGFDSLLANIDTRFDLQPVRDETDFENQLYQHLTANYGKGVVERQVGTRAGERVDLVIGNKYALELKLVSGRSNLRDLIGQLHFYKKTYPNLAVVLADIGAIDIADINEFIKEYANMGVRSIIKRTTLRSKSKKRGIRIDMR